MRVLEIVGLYLLFAAGIVCFTIGLHIRMKIRRQAKAVVRLAEKFCRYAVKDWYS